MYKILFLVLFLVSCGDTVDEEIMSDLVGRWSPKFLMTDGGDEENTVYNTPLEIQNAFINNQSDSDYITSAEINIEINNDYTAYIYVEYDILIDNVINQRTEGMIGTWSASEQTFCLYSLIDNYCFDYELNNSELSLSMDDDLLILEID